MTTLNISLPKSMKGFVESQIKAGGYSTASEYVRELIRAAQKRAAQENLERLLMEGLNSRPPISVNDDYWSRKKAELKVRHAKLKKRA